MNKILYPLIVSDFDGTLLRSDYTVAKETKSTIEKYIAAGGIFVISTGRSYTSILKMAKELSLKGLVSALQGSTIADIETGKILLDGHMTTSEGIKAALAFEAISEHIVHLQVYTLTDLYSTKDDDELRLYEKITKTKAIVTNKKASESIAEKKLQPKKIIAIVEAAYRNEIYEKLKRLLGDQFYVSYSDSNFVEVSVGGYTKGTALEFLAEYYGIPKEKTLAIGDNLNDLPMLECAGKGIAIKNCDRALAERIVPFEYSNDENGVGKAIEKYGFAEENI